MATAHVRKPDWLKIRLSGNDDFRRTKEIVESPARMKASPSVR